jgi:RNA polymerase sigma-70 factor (ECF subfamily)
MRDSDPRDLADIEAVLAGDREVFAEIVKRHGEAVQRQMRGFTRDRGQIEELVQEVFVEAYLSLGKFRGEAPFRHWLSRIATLIGYKFWRRRDKNSRLVPLSEVPEPAGTGEGRESSGGSEAAAQLLFDLLATLPPEDRLVMTMMYLDRLGQEEIARRLGWTRVMVAVRLYRAKKRLKRLGEREPWKGRLEWMLS